MMNYENYFLSFYETDYNVVMKSSSIHKIISCSFIKYYRVVDKNIVIYFNDGKLSIPYSKDLEVEILDKMKKQINNAKVMLNEKYLLSSSFFLGSGLVQLYWAINNAIKIVNVDDYISYFGPVTNFFLASILMTPFFLYQIKANDVNKHKLFLKHEDEINSFIKEAMIKSGLVNEESINLVPKFSSYATINDVHFMSKGEVRNLVNGNVSEEMIYKLRKDR